MRKSKFSETQIIGILKDAESAMPVAANLSRPRCGSRSVARAGARRGSRSLHIRRDGVW